MNTVVVASDVCLFRQGVTSVLAGDGRLDVAAVVSDARALLALLGAKDTVPPGAVLLDMGMPHAYPVCCTIVRDCPGTKVIALCISECAEEIWQCAEAGVAGFVSREGSIEELVHAVNSALRGDLACSERVAALLLDRVGSTTASVANDGSLEQLTPRELEVAELVNEGLSNKEIARQLNITLATTKNHVHHLLEKLGARHRTEAAAIYRRTASPPEDRRPRRG